MSKRVYGCIKSKLDGTEYIWDKSMTSLPKEYSFMSVMPPILDQGSDPKCVCYALTGYLDWKVNKTQGDNISENFDIDKLYSIREQQNLNGMTLKEGLQYLKHTGLNKVKIKGYAKVNSYLHLQSAIIMNGPCPAALFVQDSSRDDFWNGNKNEGGHAILVIGYNKIGFIIRNSWGKNWGKSGYTILPYKEFNKFMEIWTIY